MTETKDDAPALDADHVARALVVGVGMLTRRLRQTRTDGELTLPRDLGTGPAGPRRPRHRHRLARRSRSARSRWARRSRALEARGLVARRPDPDDGRAVVSRHRRRARGLLEATAQRAERSSSRRRWRPGSRGPSCAADGGGTADRAAGPEHLMRTEPDGRRNGAMTERPERRSRRGRPLQVGGAGEHDGGHVHVRARRLDRHHRAARDLPRHPPRSARSGQHRLPAVDDHGLPAGAGRARWSASAASATCTAGCGSTTPGSSSSRSPRSCSRSTRSTAARGAMWLIGWRMLQAIGGSMLDGELGRDPDRRVPRRTARLRARASTRSPACRRQFIGLVAGGVLASIDWRAVFWVNVPGRRVRHGVGIPQAARHR